MGLGLGLGLGWVGTHLIVLTSLRAPEKIKNMATVIMIPVKKAMYSQPHLEKVATVELDASVKLAQWKIM